MRLALTLFTVLIGALQSAHAESDWTDIGPANAVTVQVTCHPNNSDAIFYIADSGHLYRSLNKGKDYQRISQRIALAVQPHRQLRSGANSFAIDPRPNFSNVVYFSPGSPGAGLWKSEMLGDKTSWVRVGDKSLGQGVVSVNYEGHVICLTLQQEVVISKDMGKTWEITNSKFPFHFDYQRWVSATNWKVDLAIGLDNTLYVCDRKQGNGIWISRDSGYSWENKIQGTWFVDMCTSPADQGVALAFGREGEVYRSKDSGKSWKQSSVLSSNDGGKSWAETNVVKHGYWEPATWPMHQGGIEINHKNVAIAIGRMQMGISTDGGKTFKVRNEADIPWKKGDYIHHRRDSMSLKCCSISASPEGNLWFFGDGQVLKKSTDNGQSWIGSSTGLHGLWMYGNPCVDITDPDTFHIASVDGGHAFTTDHGKTWTQSTPTPKKDSCQGISQDPSNPQVFYKAHGYNPILFYKSTDSGRTFTQISTLNLPSGDYMGRILIDPTDSNRLYYTQRGGAGVYRSDDGGQEFTLVYEARGITHSLVTKKGNVYFRIWGDKGIYRYLKQSGDWEEITGNKDVDGFAVHPDDENIVFYSSRTFPDMAKGALLKTTNALSPDRKWNELGNYGSMHLYIDPYKPRFMLMMTNQKNVGMMLSSDSGENWKSIHNNHATSFIWGFVAGGPKAKGRVYTYDSVACYIDDIYDPEYTGPQYEALQENATTRAMKTSNTRTGKGNDADSR